MVQLKISLPDGFLDEEVRNEYHISRNMKEIWAVELDLLAEFDRVCKKYNLTYFVAGGTMLGAVRHGGFIPWDDDIDVTMFRDQYELFLEVAAKEFVYPYFLQTSKTDIGSFNGHAKLRNSETTAILNPIDYFEEMKINQGIFLDIFPSDNVTEDKDKLERQEKRATQYKKIADQLNACTRNGYKQSPNTTMRYIRKVLSRTMSPLFERMALFMYDKHDKECQRYNCENTKKFSFLSYSFDPRWQGVKTDYDKTCEMDFEFMKVPVCKGYENALTTIYGDWHQFVKGGAKHIVAKWDASLSYRNYLK